MRVLSAFLSICLLAGSHTVIAMYSLDEVMRPKERAAFAEIFQTQETQNEELKNEQEEKELSHAIDR